MQKKGRSSQETIVQSWGRVLVPPEEVYIKISLSCPAGTKGPPTKVEDGKFRQSTRFLEHHRVMSPLTNQKKSPTLQPLPQILPIKTSPLKPLGSLGFWGMSHLFSLLGPAINLSLLQIPMFRFVWLHCESGT